VAYFRETVGRNSPGNSIDNRFKTPDAPLVANNARSSPQIFFGDSPEKRSISKITIFYYELFMAKATQSLRASESLNHLN
jgi:hypothetical protein